MKKFLLFTTAAILISTYSCKKSFDCNCTESSNAVVIDEYTITSDGADAIEVCDAQDEQYNSGVGIVIVDCEPK